MEIFRTLGLVVPAIVAELVGCYFPYLYLKEGKSLSLILPTVFTSAWR